MDLHDFVLNLISDADARTAFALDPEACLHAAGLTDVTPADVHDAIPLVVDYAPARVAGLTSGLPDLTSAALQRVDAVVPVQPLAAGPLAAGLTNSNLTLAAAGGVTSLTGLHADTGGLDVADYMHGQVGPVEDSGGAGGTTGHGDGAGSDPFSPAHDPATTLDSGATGGLVPHTVGTVTGTLDSAHELTGTLDHTGILDPGGLTSGLTSTVPSLTSAVPGLDGHGLGGVSGLDALHGLTDTSGLLGGSDPLHLGGDASGSTDTHATGDAHLLDVTHLF